ncbi:hypothetical protein DFQ27_006599 [Actinomortierella ambigua]|uniref:Methyltransferase n=1 Tax=Actinomortierella ambigua TaxID=1343610 RepID=A0A9P6U0V4_9FUNG|nr:hypothetical protein DFQ27_006599 [Actinomortierella ambigua]
METLAVRHPGFWKSKRVLELGAGQGIVSMSAIALGAASVTITDLESALPTIENSLRLNRFDNTILHSSSHSDNDHDHLQEHLDQTEFSTLRNITHIHLMPLDWVHHARDLAEISARLLESDDFALHRQPTTGKAPALPAPEHPPPFPIDYILASDVVWVDYLIPSLVETMAALLGISVDEDAATAPALVAPLPPTSQQQQQQESLPPSTNDQDRRHHPWPVILLAHQTRSTRGDKILFEALARFGLAKTPIRLEHEDHDNHRNSNALPAEDKKNNDDPDEPALELEHVLQDPLFRKPNIVIYKIWRTK